MTNIKLICTHLITVGTVEMFEKAPDWATHLVSFNGSKYFTDTANPEPLTRYSKAAHPYNEGHFNEHMFKSKHKFIVEAARINQKQDSWDGEGRPQVGQVCVLDSDINVVILGKTKDIFNKTVYTVQDVDSHEIFIARSDEFMPYYSDRDLKDREVLIEISNILRKSVDDEQVLKMFRLFKEKS